MQSVVDAPKVETQYGALNIVETAVVYDKQNEEVRIFVLNTDENEDVALDIDLQGFDKKKLVRHLVLAGTSESAINTFEKPNEVEMKELPVTEGDVVLPKMSWNVLILK